MLWPLFIDLSALVGFGARIWHRGQFDPPPSALRDRVVRHQLGSRKACRLKQKLVAFGLAAPTKRMARRESRRFTSWVDPLIHHELRRPGPGITD